MTSLAFPLLLSMPEDERKRLTGGGRGNTGRRRGGRRENDPMGLFTYACIAMILAVVGVYCVSMLRASPGDDTSGPLQGLLAVIPLALLLANLLGKGRDDP